jgi:hypothetical protein
MASIAKDEHGNKWVAYYAKKFMQEIITMYDDRITSGNQKIKIAKQANPNAPILDLESQVESSKAQKQKIEEVLSGIK